MAAKRPNNQPATNKRNSLSLTTPVYHQLLKKLNAPPGHKPSTHPNRCFTRLEYCDPYLELTLTGQDNGHRTKITVATRNISRGGISVLHSSFIYPGTIINTKLHRTDGSNKEISGKVCRCEHRGGIVHEIGIEFSDHIIVQEFVESNIHNCVRSLEFVNPSQLKGSILFVGKDPNIIPLIRQYLLTTDLSFGFADSAQEALDKNYREHDLIFTCLDAGDQSGSEFVRTLRDAGYNRPIIISGKADSQAIKQQVGISSADMFLETPFTESQLLCALAEFLIFAWSDQQLELFRSSEHQANLDSLLTTLSSLGVKLESQLETNDPVQVYITGTEIRKAALSLGMKSLHDLTLKVCDEIAQSGDLSAFESDLNRIRLLCLNKKAA